MKRVLVTGGAGFLGSHLCDRLIADGCRVLCMDSFETGAAENLAGLIDHGRFDFVQHDVASPLEIDLRVDEIFHLACPASPPQYQRDPVRTIRTSVIGTMNVLELARRSRARLLFSSTSEVYGDPQEHPQSEGYWGHVNPIGERACYDEGKRCAEALVTSYSRQYGIDCRIARVFNTYGPRMREDDGRVVSNFAIQALQDEPITIYGDGSQTRSFCYVSDLVEGLIRLMRCPTDPGPVNLGNPFEVEVRALAELIVELTGSRSSMVHRPLPGDDPARRRPDITWAREVLGWQPTVDLSDGLAQTIAYFRGRLAGDLVAGQIRRAGASV
ncbi:MAG TPA: UDP-glucuronic acid decarboxylase family protein [Kofleriaceae bacterium]|nr:UDP-glucuronic acid decarboxylase family protein [Kofleriaceae bacterium]